MNKSESSQLTEKNLTEEEIIWKKLSSLPALNTAEALEYAGGNQEILIILYKKYAKIAEEALEKLTAEINSKQMENVLRSAHSLKGTCATIGAKNISTLALELEHTLRDDINSDIDALYRKLCSEIQELINELRDIFPEADN